MMWLGILRGTSLEAAVLTWDPSGVGQYTDGGGTWDSASSLWWDGNNGDADVAWPNTTGDTAIFGAGAGAGPAGTVTVNGTVTANALIFNAAGTGEYTLNGGTICLGGVSPSITTNAPSATITSTLSGSNGLTVAGNGMLTVTTANLNYTGNTTINGGTLTLSSGGNYTNGNTYINNGSTLRIAASGQGFWITGQSFTFDNNGGGTLDTGSGANIPTNGGTQYVTNGGATDYVIGGSGLNLNTQTTTFNVARGTGTSDLTVSTSLWNSSDVQ